MSGVRIFTQVAGGESGGTAGGVVRGASGVPGGTGFFRPTSNFILLAILSRIFSYSECVISPESSISRKLLNSGPERFHRAGSTCRFRQRSRMPIAIAPPIMTRARRPTVHRNSGFCKSCFSGGPGGGTGCCVVAGGSPSAGGCGLAAGFGSWRMAFDGECKKVSALNVASAPHSTKRFESRTDSQQNRCVRSDSRKKKIKNPFAGPSVPNLTTGGVVIGFIRHGWIRATRTLAPPSRGPPRTPSPTPVRFNDASPVLATAASA